MYILPSEVVAIDFSDGATYTSKYWAPFWWISRSDAAMLTLKQRLLSRDMVSLISSSSTIWFGNGSLVSSSMPTYIVPPCAFANATQVTERSLNPLSPERIFLMLLNSFVCFSVILCTFVNPTLYITLVACKIWFLRLIILRNRLLTYSATSVFFWFSYYLTPLMGLSVHCLLAFAYLKAT